jgi:Papain family cysteine protease
VSAARVAKPAAAKAPVERVCNARRDTLDFRDVMYTPTLVEVPAYRKLEDYRRAKVPVLDQGSDGSCTGFGLATVAHYLLRTHRIVRDSTDISPFMLYDMARRYDEWPGEAYDGSSCRGAMKGWNKHGVCGRDKWPKSRTGAPLDHASAEDAAKRPLGAYFRVNHGSLVAMHAAITEAGALYASATVHAGWQAAGRDGIIKPSDEVLGGHAFAIVAYDADGFWIQNSWGTGWGKHGFGHVSYDDWLENGTDTWVARLGVPVRLEGIDGARGRTYVGAVRAKSWSYADLRPHVINIGDHGLLDPHGDIGTTPEMVKEIVRNDIPRITRDWAKKRIVLYAHGGLVGQDDALQRVNEYRDTMLPKECYPLAFIWNSDFWTTLKELLNNAVAQRRPEGFLDSTKDFMLDRLDDVLEPLARHLGGRAEWSKMKDNALGATVSNTGGAFLVANELASLIKDDPSIEIHVACHSAGSIFHAPLLQLLATKGTIRQGPMQGKDGLGLRVESCTLWAPAATTALFRDSYLPLIESGGIGKLALFQLDDGTEQDDNCASIYHKSLLYLVSNAFEDHARVPLEHPEGEPIVGMQKFVDADDAIHRIFTNGTADRVIAPTSGLPAGDPNASEAKHHADFDDDPPTLMATMARILGSAASASTADIVIKTGTSRNREIRRTIDKMQDFAATR